MNGNVCPKCGKAVMTYARFFREAEPTKISKCGACGTDLRRSKSVYGLLLAMGIILPVAMFGVFSVLSARGFSMTAIVIAEIILFLGGVLLTNYAGFVFIGWKPAATPEGSGTVGSF